MKINEERLITRFLELVQIDSPSGYEEKVSKYIQKQFKKANVDFKEDEYGNLIAKIPGKFGQPLLISAHMDTFGEGGKVKPHVKGDVISSVGKKDILGVDDKAGITEILEAIQVLKENKVHHRPLEIIFTREEKHRLLGAYKLKKVNLRAKEGLNFDRQGMGEICLAAPFVYRIDIDVKGKAAHAGNEPEKGVSAIQVAAEAITKLKLGRIDKDTTNNVGVLQGGEFRRGVPGHAYIKAETRSLLKSKADKQVEAFKRAFKSISNHHKANVIFKASLAVQGYRYKANDKYIQKIEEVMKLVKIKPNHKVSGGMSDANAFREKGIKVVDISCGGRNAHTHRESIKISDMKKVGEFLVRFCTIK